MTILGNVWTVVKNLTATIIVLAMFSRVSGAFETLVIAGLTLIYTAIVGSATLLGNLQIDFSLQSARRNLKLFQHFNHPESGAFSAAVEEAAGDLRLIRTKRNINLGFNFLLWAIAVFNIVSVL